MNEPKTLTKNISCEFKCKFDGGRCNSNQKWNNDKCRCLEKIILGILLHEVVKMVNMSKVLLTIQSLRVTKL